MSRKITTSFIAFAFLLIQLSFFYPVQALAQAVDTANLVVEDSTGKILAEGDLEITEDSTALTLLQNLVGTENVELDYYEDKPYIVGINGLNSYSDEVGFHYWSIIYNGEYSELGVSEIVPKANDVIQFVFVTWFNEPVAEHGTVTIKNGSSVLVDSESFEITEGKTALDALKEVVGEENVSIVDDPTYGAYITGINGIMSEGTYYWAFYVNGGFAEEGIGSYQVQPEDELLFEYVSWDTTTPEDPGTEEPEPTDPEEIDQTELNNKVKELLPVTKNYLLNAGINTAWEAIAISQFDGSVPASYLTAVKQELRDKEGTFRNVTDYERHVLGISAAGGNPTDIEGYNLIEKIYNNERMTNQGLNGPIFALIAFDSKQFEIPSDALWTRDKLITYILDAQNTDGGFGLFGSTSDVDVTAMALSALANYQDNNRVKEATNHALAWLSSVQNENGGFSSSNGEASESTAEVIIALSSLKVNPMDEMFTKENGNLISHLLQFGLEDGQFSHLIDQGGNDIATEKAFLALVAYNQFLASKNSVYDFTLTPVIDVEEEVKQPEVSKPNPVKEAPTESETQQPSSDDQQKDSDSDVGHPLPNTATSAYNVLLIGLLLLVVGVAFYTYSNKRKLI
ncbi:DUF4430 domain-containing protein [Litchfieldia alkalitelluris]|uniref:DUF4430 domain-containing protein n=1 Tax=Litchfieldia alkalitelluris TaxID=304268 RepID=UPI0009962DDC|nr:DUF4430 domain-containing protein [Litchfieldia alkalitelluris]